MINFNVKKCHIIEGGLCFQLVNKLDDSKEIDLETIDYTNSIACSEYAFAIIEDIFCSSFSLEQKRYYHNGFHIHGLNDLQEIINKITALETFIHTKSKPHLIYTRADLIASEGTVESLKKGNIRLAWSTDEMRKNFITAILKKKYRKKLLHFLAEVKEFLINNQTMSNSQGIYVLGI